MALKQVSPVITRQTTMWKAWVGFNTTNSFVLATLLYAAGLIAAAA